jgi:hypothetical protein
MKIIAITILMLSSIISDNSSPQNSPSPNYGPRLDVEHYLSDTTGIILPSQIIKCTIGDLIKIYRPDGFYYTGKITELEEGEGIFKIYGQINNVEDAGFGFILAKGGILAGAIVERKNSKTYVLEFSENLKKFILVRSFKNDKVI